VVIILSSRYTCQSVMKLELSQQVFENTQDFIKISAAGTEFFHAIRQTHKRRDGQNTTKLIVAFRNFVSASSKERPNFENAGNHLVGNIFCSLIRCENEKY
jgi:hypothetical protein